MRRLFASGGGGGGGGGGAGAVVKTTNDYPLATLQAFGAVSAVTVTIPAFPAGTSLLRAEIEIVDVPISPGPVVAATATVERPLDLVGALISAVDLLGRPGFYAPTGTNPFVSQGGTTLLLDLTIVGDTFDNLTAGHFRLITYTST